MFRIAIRQVSGHSPCKRNSITNPMLTSVCTASQDSAANPKESERLAEFRKKLRETTPINDLGEQMQSKKEDVLPPWPNNRNPNTGEVGGPRGPEPTRYGDWERKGRVTDF